MPFTPYKSQNTQDSGFKPYTPTEPAAPEQSEGGFFSTLARGAARTPLKFLGTAQSALESAGQLITGQKEKAAETISKGSERMRGMEKALGYKEGEISTPYMIGTPIERQMQGEGMFGKETTDVLSAGAELASYAMGGPEAKSIWEASQATGIPLAKLAFAGAKREAVAAAVGSMGAAGQEKDATLGTVAQAGIIGAPIGFAAGFATPFVSKAWTNLKNWNKAADDALNAAEQQTMKKTPTHWTQQTEPKPVEVTKPLSQVDEDLFPETASNAVPMSKDLKKKAIDYGFKPWQPNLIEEMSPEEKNVARKMVSMAEEMQGNRMADHPVTEAANPIVEQVRHLQITKKTSGELLDSIVETMPDKPVSIETPANKLLGWLYDRNVRVIPQEGGGVSLDFSRSKFTTSASNKDRAIMQEVFDQFFPKDVPKAVTMAERTPKEIRTMRQRLFKILEANKSTSEPFSDEIDTLLTSARQELNKPLNSLSEEYATQSKNYAVSSSELRDFMKFLGKDFYDAQDEDIANRVSELLPRLASNVAAKPGVILKNLRNAALETGMKKLPIEDPRRLIYFTEMLNDAYGLHAPRGFQGSIERAGEKALEGMKLAGDIATGNKIGLASRALKMFSGDPVLKRRQLIKQMLQDVETQSARSVESSVAGSAMRGGEAAITGAGEKAPATSEKSLLQMVQESQPKEAPPLPKSEMDSMMQGYKGEGKSEVVAKQIREALKQEKLDAIDLAKHKQYSQDTGFLVTYNEHLDNKDLLDAIKNHPYYRKEGNLKDIMGEGVIFETQTGKWRIATTKDEKIAYLKKGYRNTGLGVDQLAQEAGFDNGSDFLEAALKQNEEKMKLGGMDAIKRRIQNEQGRMMGAAIGLEPEYDENGKFKGIKYNPKLGAIGVAGTLGAERLLGKAGKEEAEQALLREAKNYASPEEFVKSQFEKPSYGMSHRPTLTGATADEISQIKHEMGFPKDFYQHPEYYEDMTLKPSKESFAVLKKVRGNPEAEITIYRASPRSTFNPGDWVSLSKEYAKGESAVEGTKVHSMKVKAKDVQFAGDSINEFGYWPEEKLKNLWHQANEKRTTNKTTEIVKELPSAKIVNNPEPEILHHGEDKNVETVQKKYNKILEVKGNQRTLLNELAQAGDKKAKNILENNQNQFANFFVEADKYINNKFRKNFDAIKYNHIDRGADFPNEYHDLGNNKFYSTDKSTAEVYAMQSRGEKYKK